MKFAIGLAATLIALATASADAATAPTRAPGTTAAAHADKATGPAIPSDAKWAGSVIVVIIALFVAAAVIGPVYRASMPEEIPPAHSHDEPPGASHHHGASGTIDHEAPEKHHH